MAVSLRIPEALVEHVAKLAEAQGTTTHAFILEAIREKVDADEARAALHAKAKRRLAAMKRAGTGIPAVEVFDYLRKRAGGGKPTRPRAIKPG